MNRRRIRSEVRFSIVPEWVIDHPEIGDSALRLYAVLARYADGEGRAFPSRATLATRVGKSVKWVDRLLRQLEDAGAVTVERGRTTPAGDQDTNLYTLRVTPPGGGELEFPTPPDGGEPELPGGGEPESPTGGELEFAQTRTTGNENQGNEIATATAAAEVAIPIGEQPINRQLFSVVAHVWGADVDPHSGTVQGLTTQAAGFIARAVGDLLELGATPDEVLRRARNYWITYRRRPTPGALVKHWPTLHVAEVDTPTGHLREAQSEDELAAWLGGTAR